MRFINIKNILKQKSGIKHASLDRHVTALGVKLWRVVALGLRAEPSAGRRGWSRVGTSAVDAVDYLQIWMSGRSDCRSRSESGWSGWLMVGRLLKIDSWMVVGPFNDGWYVGRGERGRQTSICHCQVRSTTIAATTMMQTCCRASGYPWWDNPGKATSTGIQWNGVWTTIHSSIVGIIKWGTTRTRWFLL